MKKKKHNSDQKSLKESKTTNVTPKHGTHYNSYVIDSQRHGLNEHSNTHCWNNFGGNPWWFHDDIPDLISKIILGENLILISIPVFFNKKCWQNFLNSLKIC